MFGLFEVLIGCVAVLISIYSYNISKHSYWKRLNVEGPEPVPIFGNLLDLILWKTSTHEMFRDLYQTWKHKSFVGLYRGTNPALLINDPDLIKHILIKDFATFSDRGITVNEDLEPLTANLFLLESHRWRGLRNKLSPVFTSGKLKQMYHLLIECADVFEKYVDELVAKNDSIEVKELTTKFTTDVIGSCAFGLNLSALSSEDSEFRKIGLRILSPNLTGTIANVMREFSPSLFKLFKMTSIPQRDTKFFMAKIAETVAHRKKNSIVRPDFLHLLMKLQENPDETHYEIMDKLLAAQAFVFFLAGFETSSSAMSFALYELAQNKKIQEKLRTEIRDALKTHNGQLPYEAVRELNYLDKVFQEVLRKHPPVSFLVRMSTRDYTIPDTNVEVPVGTKVFIPVLGLHYDEEYYPNPTVFDPERFTEEAIQGRSQMVYLPFGNGPRNCIGARLANYQTKVGIIKIVQNYEVTISPKMQVPYAIQKSNTFLSAVGGIYLDFKKVP